MVEILMREDQCTGTSLLSPLPVKDNESERVSCRLEQRPASHPWRIDSTLEGSSYQLRLDRLCDEAKLGHVGNLTNFEAVFLPIQAGYHPW